MTERKPWWQDYPVVVEDWRDESRVESFIRRHPWILEDNSCNEYGDDIDYDAPAAGVVCPGWGDKL